MYYNASIPENTIQALKRKREKKKERGSFNLLKHCDLQNISLSRKSKTLTCKNLCNSLCVCVYVSKCTEYHQKDKQEFNNNLQTEFVAER